MAEMRVENERAFLEWALETLHEINVSNYDHDDVCRLNERSVEVIIAIQARLSSRPAAPSREAVAVKALEFVEGQAFTGAVESYRIYRDYGCPGDPWAINVVDGTYPTEDAAQAAAQADYEARILSCLTATHPEDQSDWQPIGSAPKDGSQFEARYDDGTAEEGVYWADTRQCILGSRAGECGPGCMSSEVGLPVDPTHWRRPTTTTTPPDTAVLLEKAADILSAFDSAYSDYRFSPENSWEQAEASRRLENAHTAARSALSDIRKARS